ncbi:MbtH family protein [Aquibacillus rhizosphaerae]|uniref:MbtH family protein n=1 Tax=Aquibacillus rhizosphaerae TaxID=3051431 RepID=A0ABT7L3T8_9BACI|nr:MbtH family protein [Aquibacillus sp. LR5S19]MDL4840523.1 MbtH family protein [Aquibacillus sp. LR5S19]
MKNPFDHEELGFYALKNDKGQYSLWPSYLDIPTGWDIQFGVANRTDCISYIETHWKDICANASIQETSVGQGT